MIKTSRVTRWSDYFSIFRHLQQSIFNFLPKWVQNNAPTLIKPVKKFALFYQLLAKVAKFRQIWSHWMGGADEYLSEQWRPLVFFLIFLLMGSVTRWSDFLTSW